MLQSVKGWWGHRTSDFILSGHPGSRLGSWVLAQLISAGNSNSSEYFIIQAAQGGVVEFEKLWQLPCLNPRKVPRESPYPTYLISYGIRDLSLDLEYLGL